MMSKSKLPKFIYIIAALLFSSCLFSKSSNPSRIPISIMVDEKALSVSAAAGETIADLLSRENIQLGDLDRTEPPLSTIIDHTMTINVIRIIESYLLVDEDIPFEEQVIQNESLPAGESYLLQQGQNGLRQITYRVITENGVEKTRNVFSESIILESIPQIMMVGITKPFLSIPIPGKLVYIIAGNAWYMENNTSNRKQLTQTNDLDGRIFEISPDGKWLLFTRKSDPNTANINSLWIASLEPGIVLIKDLNVSNIIQHAAWAPGKFNTLTYSTVEPRETSPGWQANNDLWVLTFSEGGSVWRNEKVIEANGGGEYGWWGSNYYWSSDGSTLVYSRPDEIGYVDFQTKSLIPLIDQQAFNTHADWAWESHIGWAPGSSLFYWQNNHINSSGTQQLFSVDSFNLNSQMPNEVIQNAGMFSYPTPAPLTAYGHYYLTYLQAIQTNQGETSRYQLVISEQDGSNSHICFPSSDSMGLNPQKPVWAPDYDESSQLFIAVLLDGNLWFVDAIRCNSFQITSDGLISLVDWR